MIILQICNANRNTFEYLIGNPIEVFDFQLPRQIDVLRLYYNLPKQTESKKIASILKQIQQRYRQSGIHVKGSEMIRIKIKRLVKSCKDLVAKRKICSNSNAERSRQENFQREIHNLFEVAQSANQLSLNQIEFLNDQRTNRMRQIDPDMNDSANEEQTSDSGSIASSSMDSFEEHTVHNFENVFQNEECDEFDYDDSDPEYTPSDDEYSSQTKQPIPHTLLEKISESKGSYRMCENLLKIGVQIPGGDPNQYRLSKTSLWKELTKLRTDQKNQMLTELAESDCKVVIQFDGKNYRKLNERHIGTQERVIVMCHSEKGDIALGLFPVTTHSSLNCAAAVLGAIRNNNLQERIVALVCDTENVNTGRLNGVCAEIERELRKPFLRLMCRHHIFEVVLRWVFESIFGATTGPRINTFNLLNENWHQIKFNGFRYAAVDQQELESPIIKTFLEKAIDIIPTHANSQNIRDDYAELNDLILKFLGLKTEKNFNVPGATNNARWMARSIYALKLYLFRLEIDMDPNFEKNLLRFCLFVSLIYTKFWNLSSNVLDAAFNAINFMKDLDQYAQFDQQISDVALEAFARHLWYLSDELILLSLFSNKVPPEQKFDLCVLLIKHVGQRTQNSIKHTENIEDIPNLELSDFISPRSFFLLHLLDIDLNFLKKDPANWNQCKTYLIAQKKVSDLIVAVNDSSERALQFGAKLIDDQRVRTENRLQDFIVSSYSNHAKTHNKMLRAE